MTGTMYLTAMRQASRAVSKQSAGELAARTGMGESPLRPNMALQEIRLLGLGGQAGGGAATLGCCTRQAVTRSMTTQSMASDRRARPGPPGGRYCEGASEEATVGGVEQPAICLPPNVVTP